MPQIRFCGISSSVVDLSFSLCTTGSGDGRGVDGRGTGGRGHVISLLAAGQNSLILSKRYHCLSGVRPRGVIFDGTWPEPGILEELRIRFNFMIGLSSASFISISSGIELEIMK